jgi:hypothetical protein
MPTTFPTPLPRPRTGSSRSRKASAATGSISTWACRRRRAHQPGGAAAAPAARTARPGSAWCAASTTAQNFPVAIDERRILPVPAGRLKAWLLPLLEFLDDERPRLSRHHAATLAGLDALPTQWIGGEQLRAAGSSPARFPRHRAHRPPAPGFTATLRPYQQDRPRLAAVPARVRPRRHPCRRHGAGQDGTDPGPPAPGKDLRARRPAQPGGRHHQPDGQLAQRGRAVHARPEGADPARQGSRRAVRRDRRWPTWC